MKYQRCSLVLWLVLSVVFPFVAQASSELSVRGRHFIGADGRVVILRGVNLSGGAKQPPFLHFSTGIEELDRLEAWGLNVIRLLFIWEAYEPERGHYDERYLDQVTGIVDAAHKLGIYTIIDMHQDSFSRYIDRGWGSGCGIGFPAWVTGARASAQTAPSCGPMWAVKTATNQAMHQAYTDFYADRLGARTAYLERGGESPSA